MLWKKKRIPCYVLVFDQVEIIKKSLRFLAAYSNDLDLIVIENPSPNTPKIRKLVDKLGREGVVKRYYLFEENITGNAYGEVLDAERKTIEKSPYVMITDGDLTSSDTGWLEEERRVLAKYHDVFACGVTMDTVNLPLKAFPSAKDWIPADMHEHEQYFEAFTGVHLLLFRGSELAGFLRWRHEKDLSFVDVNMHKYCYEVLHKKWARTKHSKLYHLTWDLYQDRSHKYTKFKTSKDFDAMWHHGAQAGYTLYKY